jgi:fatty-acyl-CoA synthase
MPREQAPWVDSLTIGRMLQRTVVRHGDREALVFPQGDYRRTYQEFYAETQQVAAALLGLGIQPGEHVAVWATNWPEWVLLQFATASIGAVLVNINPAYRSHELQYVLHQADVTTLFLTDRFKGSDYFALLTEACPELASCQPGNVEVKNCPLLRRVISIKETKAPGISNWQEFLQKADATDDAALFQRQLQARPEEVVNIQFTSGTTGFPKGAMLTHRNLLMNAYYVGERMRFSERDRLCIPVPLYHCFGCVLGTLVCAVYGAAMVFPAEGFDPLATLQAIHDERCTALYGVPTMFIAEVNHPQLSEFDLSSLRTGIMAGSPCPIEVMRAVGDKLGATEMTIAYGLTEAAPIITQTAVTDSLEQRVGTVGRILPGLEVMIVQPGTLQPVEPGQSGELVVRGHGNMKGYYKKPVETAQALTPDGWLRSGDLAQLMAEGYYRITGRIKDVIIRGGENIYPREIEEFLYTNPAIADVQVVGLPDLHFGEEVSAWVCLKPGHNVSEQELKDYCKGRIAHYKVPRYVVFVQEYPKTVTGKIQKFKLKEMGIERFELQKAAQVETA